MITYTYVVTNTSTNEALTNVTVSDPMSGLSAIDCGGGSPTIPALDAGTSQTCTATYTTTQADVHAGSITNTGTATGTPPSGPDVSASSAVTIEEVPEPAISIVKSASVQSYTSAGTGITYDFQVTNTGNETLTNVTVTDPLSGLSSISCNGGTNVISALAPGASATCTATYTTTQTDVTVGSLSNTATASGTTPEGPGVSAESSVTIPVVGQPFTCDSPEFLPLAGVADAALLGDRGFGVGVVHRRRSHLHPDVQRPWLRPSQRLPLRHGVERRRDERPAPDRRQWQCHVTRARERVRGGCAATGCRFIRRQRYLLIVTRGTSTSTAYEIDVTSSPPAVIYTVTLSAQYESTGLGSRRRVHVGNGEREHVPG